MTVNPGFGGQKFIEATLEKIKIADRIKKDKKLDFEIQVDGGINKVTAAKVISAGATMLVGKQHIFLGRHTQNYCRAEESILI
jgi:ribulose-phosphate 3-epimerase